MFFPPDVIGHLANAVGDKIVGFVVEKTLGKVVAVVSNLFGKHKAVAESSGDPKRLEAEVERISEAVSALEAAVVVGARDWDWRLADEEASEPAFAQFVDEAMDAAAASRTPSKRLMLGRLIARRLQVRTESTEELALRRALRVADDLTESQLLLLAAAVLVQRLPAPDVPQFGSRDAAEAWLRAYCGPALDALVPRVPWDSDDFEVLASDGAILMDAQPTFQGQFGTHRDGVEQWLHMHGVSPYDGLEGEWGTRESHALFRARFPTIVALKRLASNGRGGDAEDHDLIARRIDDAVPTPLGAQLGIMVFQQLGMPALERGEGAAPTADGAAPPPLGEP
jgi:hypothetical protein